MTRLLALLALLLTTPAQAYWEYGHETVARLAYDSVKPSTRAAIDALLAQEALLETPTCPAGTIEAASYWPDCVKELKDRFSYAFSWHYQNVDICKPFDVKSACKDGNCVSAQIDRNARLLADRSVPARERLMALAFLAHFVGDLHQPMHAGDRGDLGGNRVPMSYGIASSRRMNLHGIWDGYLAERSISTPPPLAVPTDAAERAAMAAGTTEDWSRENWEVSRDFAYATAYDGQPCRPVADREPTQLTNDEIEALVPILRQQVLRGGARLARLLDEALG